MLIRLLIVLLVVSCAFAEDSDDGLLIGFHHMYGLHFAEARAALSAWEREHPDDGRGPAGLAAAELFAELNRLGVLETEFFEDDSLFKGRPRPRPDAAVRRSFLVLVSRAEVVAERQLAMDPRDRHALFSLTLAHGLRADYAALIDKENMRALKYTREGAASASRLLAIDPGYYDAYLATGVSNYIVGSLFPPVRWLLRLGGYSGNREEGLRELSFTAEKGKLLRPFARLLLAVANLRAGERRKARDLLVGLRDEFPTNPLFAREIERLDRRGD